MSFELWLGKVNKIINTIVQRIEVLQVKGTSTMEWPIIAWKEVKVHVCGVTRTWL